MLSPPCSLQVLRPQDRVPHWSVCSRRCPCSLPRLQAHRWALPSIGNLTRRIVKERKEKEEEEKNAKSETDALPLNMQHAKWREFFQHKHKRAEKSFFFLYFLLKRFLGANIAGVADHSDQRARFQTPATAPIPILLFVFIVDIL